MISSRSAMTDDEERIIDGRGRKEAELPRARHVPGYVHACCQRTGSYRVECGREMKQGTSGLMVNKRKGISWQGMSMGDGASTLLVLTQVRDWAVVGDDGDPACHDHHQRTGLRCGF